MGLLHCVGPIVSPQGPLESVGTGAFTWTGDSKLDLAVLGEVGVEPGERPGCRRVQQGGTDIGTELWARPWVEPTLSI